MNKDLKPEFTRLRKEKINFIAVSNGEWYSLLKDEIRNSIAIEGVFANRNELLAVLERRKRTSDEKTSAILGYFDAASSIYEYANNLFLKGEFQLRLADIRQIHTLLLRYEKQIGTFNGDLGEFRKEDVAVTQSTFAPLKGERIYEVIPLLSGYKSNKFNWLLFTCSSILQFISVTNCKISTFSNKVTLKICKKV